MIELNIIGCGRAARTLARLWLQAGAVRVGGVLNRSADSARAACDFIGAGRAWSAWPVELPSEPSESSESSVSSRLWLLGTGDDVLVEAAAQLHASGLLQPQDGVFQLSGFSPSAELVAALGGHPRVASLHPVLSFADPQRACMQFAGTLCGLEGEAALCRQLEALVVAVRGECFAVEAQHKPLYHAGSVFASNFLVVLMELAQDSYRAAGVPPAVARRLSDGLARKALDNVHAQGPAAALTGPAARGDYRTLAVQQQAVSASDAAHGQAYAALTALALRLAGRSPVTFPSAPPAPTSR